MRILGVETSTLIGSVACVADGVLQAECTLDVRQTHTAVLLPTIDRVLRDAAWSIEEVDGFGVALGPGSFTGLRIGLATVKGFAATRIRPVVGIDTLEAMAYGAGVFPGLVMPVIDARRGEYYTAGYRRNGDGLERVRGPAVGPVEELFADVTEPLCCPGDVAAGLQAQIAAASGCPVHVPAPRRAGARGGIVAQLAAVAIVAGNVPPTATLAPCYLRDHLGRKPAV